MNTKPFECRIIREPREFRSLRNSRVLIYWPHGFGDWVFLSLLLDRLDQSNLYYVTRFGDHSVSLFEGSEIATPIYCGSNGTACGDGAQWNNQHFGVPSGALMLPLAAHHACSIAGIDAFVSIPFDESYGSCPAPGHSKARMMLQGLTNDQPITTALRSCLQLRAPANVKAWVEARLRTWCGFDAKKKLCVIARHGFTSIGKNWGHRWRRPGLPEAQECRDFMDLMRRDDPSWIFITMEEMAFEGDNTLRGPHCHSYCDVFADAPPLGLALKALLDFASLCVGVPTGPFHLAMVMASLPTVGIWIEHWPSWYDEPRAGAIHVLSRFLVESNADKRVGSITSSDGVDFQLMRLETCEIPGQAVFEAVHTIL